MTPTHSRQRTPSRIRTVARRTYLVAAWAFLVAISLQVFLAGAGVLADGAYLARHVSFVEVFQPLPLLLLAAALVGRLSLFQKLAPALIFGAIVLQYDFAGASHPWVAGLHTINALAMFWGSTEMVRRSTWGPGDPTLHVASEEASTRSPA